MMLQTQKISGFDVACASAIPSYFMAMRFRCQRRIVSGVTILEHVEGSLRPSAFPSMAIGTLEAEDSQYFAQIRGRAPGGCFL